MNYEFLLKILFLIIFLLPIALIIGRVFLYFFIYLWIGAIFGIEQADIWSDKWRKIIVFGESRKK